MKFRFENDGGVSVDGRTIPAYGFSFDDIFITDPRVSECGRFQVDPTQHYGLSAADAKVLVDLNQACGAIHDQP